MTYAAAHPVDIDHLNRYTGGDVALNDQILRLFDDQCIEILAKFEGIVQAPTGSDAAKKWHDTAHSLKGAARGIGAFALADIAADVEKLDPTDHSAALKAVGLLKANAAQVHRFIEDLIGASR
ncbi:MAG: hypothetical protein RJB62_510 [Pseudomonadota bacterium]|jgi:HPt (histidine-containing phosphotransfer) domain-containing protein